MKFLRVLIFAIFPAVLKNKLPQNIITADIFPAKLYSRVNILLLKFSTQKYSTKKSCLFNYNFSLSFFQSPQMLVWSNGKEKYSVLLVLHRVSTP